MTLLHGDCRAIMRDMADESVDSACTDPPYELGFMGRSWDASGIAYDVAMWREVLRVLKPGAWLIAFSHARTYHRMACAIEDAGFEIRDQIMWIYGSGFPKGGNRDGKGTCLKPAHEPIVLARKPFPASSVAKNEAIYGTGALRIDDCRIHADDALGGAYTVTRLKPGRWPANIIHDGSEEVRDTFPDANGQLAPASVRSDRQRDRQNTYGAMKGGSNGAEPRVDLDKSAARFFYCAKASKADRDEGLEEFALQAFVQFQTGNGESGKASSISEGRDTQYRNIHETVKPTDLMRWLVRLITPAGGLVFDPFTGSGSTGKAAALEGCRFIGCEMTEAYIPIARARIAHAKKLAVETSAQGTLFEQGEGR